MAERIWVVDDDPSETYPIYTRGNVGEVFPDTVAPLSWTAFGIPGAEPRWRDAFERFGVFDQSEFDPNNLEILGVFGGYCYLDVSISRIFTAQELPGLRDDQKRVNAIRHERLDLSAMSSEELIAHGRSFLPIFRELFAQHLFTSYGAITVLGTIAGICEQALGDPSLAMCLVAGMSDCGSAKREASEIR